MKKNCIVCGKEFEDRTSNHNKLYCTRNCRKNNHYKNHKEHIQSRSKEYWRYVRSNRPDIYERIKASSRKAQHIHQKKLKFGLSLEEYEARTKRCEICGWNLTHVDLHHINGKKDKTNLIALCPNHHTLIHRQGMTVEDLKKTV
jgi:predicted restriction endonuclease